MGRSLPIVLNGAYCNHDLRSLFFISGMNFVFFVEHIGEKDTYSTDQISTPCNVKRIPYRYVDDLFNQMFQGLLPETIV